MSEMASHGVACVCCGAPSKYSGLPASIDDQLALEPEKAWKANCEPYQVKTRIAATNLAFGKTARQTRLRECLWQKGRPAPACIGRNGKPEWAPMGPGC